MALAACRRAVTAALSTSRDESALSTAAALAATSLSVIISEAFAMSLAQRGSGDVSARSTSFALVRVEVYDCLPWWVLAVLP